VIGYIRYKVTEEGFENFHRMLGFSTNYNIYSFTSLKYAIYFNKDQIQVRHNGTNSNFGSYKINDVFFIKKTSNSIQYYKNEELLYEGNVYSSIDFYVQATFVDQGDYFEGITTRFYPSGSKGVTAIEDAMDTESMISVYPNPATNHLNVQLNQSTENIQFDLYNMVGAKVVSQQLNNQLNTVDISKHAKGVYFYQIIQDNQLLKTSKLIISE